MVWRNCVASVVLAQEVNGLWPGRDKSSDGTIGDANHASRKSDHNPWIKDPNGVGVVRARDIDEDLDGKVANTGPDAEPLFTQLLSLAKKGDPRLNGGGYLIYESKIYSDRNGWVARKYTGPNPHNHHIHVSFSLNPAGYDSDASWGIGKTEVVDQVLVEILPAFLVFAGTLPGPKEVLFAPVSPFVPLFAGILPFLKPPLS